MLVLLPPPPQGRDPSMITRYLGSLVSAVTDAFRPAITQTEAIRQIVLQSPDGNNWSVTVDNTGTLVVTANDGKTPF